MSAARRHGRRKVRRDAPRYRSGQDAINGRARRQGRRRESELAAYWQAAPDVETRALAIIRTASPRDADAMERAR